MLLAHCHIMQFGLAVHSFAYMGRRPRGLMRKTAFAATAAMVFGQVGQASFQIIYSSWIKLVSQEINLVSPSGLPTVPKSPFKVTFTVSSMHWPNCSFLLLGTRQ